jgi:hypothetical protein
VVAANAAREHRAHCSRRRPLRPIRRWGSAARAPRAGTRHPAGGHTKPRSRNGYPRPPRTRSSARW